MLYCYQKLCSLLLIPNACHRAEIPGKELLKALVMYNKLLRFYAGILTGSGFQRIAVRGICELQKKL